jgi:hypothetical protein
MRVELRSAVINARAVQTSYSACSTGALACELYKHSRGRLCYMSPNKLMLMRLKSAYFVGLSFLILISNLQAQVLRNPAPSGIEEDIHDIRGPVHIAYSWLWLVYLLGILCLIIGCIWLYRFLKRRRKPEKIRLPHEIALERLEQARSLMIPEKAKEFSIAVSDAIRFYIEDRFQVLAAHRTTEEFLHDLVSDSGSPLTGYSGSLEEFLRYCDLAKFACWTLSQSEMESMHTSALKLVNETRPRETVQNQRSSAAEKLKTPSHAVSAS